MCGIFAGVNEPNLDVVQHCIDKIRHRGPDACHSVKLNGICLAHCRLSIIDTDSRSDQPMSDPSGRYWIVFNGEIYNYIELRKELEISGYSFRTNSDTEVLLYAFIEWNEGFQDKCNGMWGLAIWDDIKKELFLSRDRFGVKPLYYYRRSDMFYVGSEMKSFFPIMEKKEINYEVFDRKSWFGYEAFEDCVIQGIRRIPAGHCAWFKDGVLSVRRWWNTLDHLVETPNSYDEQVECLRELFLDSCRLRMRSDVPIATALSGGVDSSAVAGAMKRVSSSNDYSSKQYEHSAFVASMPYSVIDETEYAQVVADHLGIRLHRVPISGKLSPDELLEYMYLCEDPYTTSPIPFMQTYKEMSTQGIKVTLDGHGADELFGGYTFDLFALSSENLCLERLDEIISIYNSTLYPYTPITRDVFFEQASIRKIKDYVHDSRWEDLDSLNKMLYNEVHFDTLPTLFRNYDRYSMANGVEIRMPFMDYRIVQFAFSISWTSKIRDGFTKRIVRDMARPFLLDEITFKKAKIGFNSPMTEWFRGDLKEFMLDTIHSRDFIESDLINPLAVTVMMEYIIDSAQPSFFDGADLWTAIMPYFWKKAMIG